METLRKIVERGFNLFLVLLPWQTRLIWRDATLNGFIYEYGRASLYGTQILLWILLLLFAITLLPQTHKVSWWQVVASLNRPAARVYWFFVGVLTIAALSTLWALDPDIAWYRAVILLQGGALLALVVHLPLRIERVAISWVASAVIQGGFAIWQFFTLYAPMTKWLGLSEHLPTVAGSIIVQTASERWLRAYGSLPHPNILGGFLVIALLFVVLLAFRAKTRIHRALIAVSLVVITPALFLSFSRSAWIAAIVTFILLGVWVFKRRDNIPVQTFGQIITIIIIICAILTSLLTEPTLTRILGSEQHELDSLQLRLDYQRQAWQLITANPFGGVGVGNYTVAVDRFIDSNLPGYLYQPVHNIYLLVASEIGAIGFLFFVGALCLLILELLRRVSTLDEVIIFLTLPAILIIGSVDHYWWSLEFGVLVFWLFLGLNIRILYFLDTP